MPSGDHPRKINLGCGRDLQTDCLNIDHDARWAPDIVWDLNDPFPEELRVETRRFGPIVVRHGAYEEIVAHHVFEHVRELMVAATSCLHLLQVGGVLRIATPYDLSIGAWQDPTHVRAFNEQTYRYLAEEYWYLGWLEHRFVLEDLNLKLSDFGMQEMQKKGLRLDQISRIPRAVYEISAVLRKRPLTEKERAGPDAA